jgi:hypothetical protein
VRKSEKFSVSLPWEDYQDMETSRKTAGLSRSAFVLEAIHRWKEARKKERLIETYEAGYRRIPEDPALSDALAHSAVDAFPEEEWK